MADLQANLKVIVDKQQVDGATKSAAQLRTELQKDQDAADALATAMGPELASSIEGGSNRVVAALKEVGFTADEIKANAAGIVQEGKAFAGISTDVGGVNTQMGKLHASTDRTRNVMANFVGNTTQTMPGLAGSIGPVNQAVGELVEGLAEGSINVKKLAAGGAVVAGLAVGMWALGKGAEQAAERSKDLNAAIEDLDKVTDKQALAIWNQQLIQMALDGKSAEDAMKNLADTNIIGARRLYDLSLAAGMTKEELRPLRDAIADHDAKQKQAAESAKKYGDNVGTAAENVDTLTTSVKMSNPELKTNAEIAQTAAEGFRGLAEALDTVESKLSGLLHTLDIEDSVANLSDDFDELREKTIAAAVATATGADDAKKKQEELAQAVRNTKRDVVSWADEMGNVPTSVVTDIFAQIDNSSFDRANARIAAISAARNVVLSIVADYKGATTNPAKNATSGVGGGKPSNDKSGKASAGATGAIVTERVDNVTLGEAGPEAVVPLNTMPGARPLGGGMGVTNNYSINVTVAAGANPVAVGQATVEAIRAYERANGTGWRN